MFRALPCSSSGGLRCNCIYAASDIITFCRWLSCAPVKKEHRLRKSSFLIGAQYSHLETVTIPEAAYIYNYNVDLVTVRTGNERDLWPVRGVLFKFFSKCQNCIGRQDSSIHVGIYFVLVERKLYQSVQQCTGGTERVYDGYSKG